jgi:hypothetical protein
MIIINLLKNNLTTGLKRKIYLIKTKKYINIKGKN